MEDDCVFFFFNLSFFSGTVVSVKTLTQPVVLKLFSFLKAHAGDLLTRAPSSLNISGTFVWGEYIDRGNPIQVLLFI
jgi:hypothetical protein